MIINNHCCLFEHTEYMERKMSALGDFNFKHELINQMLVDLLYFLQKLKHNFKCEGNYRNMMVKIKNYFEYDR
jgi:hypothetical protein